MSQGTLIILSGPSGVGKGTVRKYMMEDKDITFSFSISMTTRKPRAGEVNGKDYFFVSKEEFKKALDNGELLEHATFVNNNYGTPKFYVDKLLKEGKNVLLEIETNGAQQVMKKYKDYGFISIFITCCSLDELERRIRGRRSEPEEVIHERVEKARKELLLKDRYQHVVCNDDPKKCGEEILNIIKNEKIKNK